MRYPSFCTLERIIWRDSCGVSFSVSIINSGFSGSSYGAWSLVRFVIYPVSVLLYSSFESSLLHSLIEAITQPLTKFGILFVQNLLFLYSDEINGIITVELFFDKSFATKNILVMLFFLFCSEKPNWFFSVVVTLPNFMVVSFFVLTEQNHFYRINSYICKFHRPHRIESYSNHNGWGSCRLHIIR